jgi:polyribonucleotide nucleotidyltransferase
MQTEEFSFELAGKKIVAEITDLAGQTNGSVIMKCGETVVLVTAVMSEKPNSNLSYFPLSVEFEERFYAAGAILGSRFIRREGRPSDEAILSARIIDRTIRPLFPQYFRHDVQVVVTVLAVGEDDPDILGVIGTSLALGISDIPWNGPIGAVRIVRRRDNGHIIINPTYSERANNQLNFEIFACGKESTINMIETAADEMSEDDVLAVLEAASILHTQIEQFQLEIIKKCGKQKLAVTPRTYPQELTDLFQNEWRSKIEETLFSGQAGKKHIYILREQIIQSTKDSYPTIESSLVSEFFEEHINEILHIGAQQGKRADGRGMDEIRPIYARAGNISPVLHGSGIFYRGDTHIFTALTLGGPEAVQAVDTIEDREGTKRFMHHYNFPPYSVGETGKVGGFSRRQIGHGALAEKALSPVIPSKDTFPYTIRLVSETFSSNGSSSMGSVCASTIALMDGGVPISSPVAGIASGVMITGDSYQLLTDIQGPEDEHGDMDFKVAGTKNGITAIQMDVKIDGIQHHILASALEKAKDARNKILATITATISEPRKNISPRAPEITTLTILPTQIGLVIGSGGKTITKIKEESGVEEITIEDDGTVFITGRNGTGRIAADKISLLTKIYNVGEKVTATVNRITNFGAFVRLDAQNEALVHVSEITSEKNDDIEKLLAIGMQVPVVITKIENGKIAASIKQTGHEFIKD